MVQTNGSKDWCGGKDSNLPVYLLVTFLSGRVHPVFYSGWSVSQPGLRSRHAPHQTDQNAVVSETRILPLMVFSLTERACDSGNEAADLRVSIAFVAIVFSSVMTLTSPIRESSNPK